MFSKHCLMITTPLGEKWRESEETWSEIYTETHSLKEHTNIFHSYIFLDFA